MRRASLRFVSAGSPGIGELMMGGGGRGGDAFLAGGGGVVATTSGAEVAFGGSCAATFGGGGGCAVQLEAAANADKRARGIAARRRCSIAANLYEDDTRGARRAT